MPTINNSKFDNPNFKEDFITKTGYSYIGDYMDNAGVLFFIWRDNNFNIKYLTGYEMENYDANNKV